MISSNASLDHFHFHHRISFANGVTLAIEAHRMAMV